MMNAVVCITACVSPLLYYPQCVSSCKWPVLSCWHRLYLLEHVWATKALSSFNMNCLFPFFVCALRLYHMDSVWFIHIKPEGYLSDMPSVAYHNICCHNVTCPICALFIHVCCVCQLSALISVGNVFSWWVFFLLKSCHTVTLYNESLYDLLVTPFYA